MKLACTQENLHRGLNIVGRMVSRTTTLPVLSNVLLKTDTGGLRLTATDLELGVSCLVGGKVEEKGGITIPARLLAEYVGQLPHEKVQLNLNGKELQLTCEDASAKIRGISAEEFPLLPQVESTFEAVVPAATLQTAIEQVTPAVAHDESRPELSGVYLQCTEKTCTLAATDSFRLAERTIPLERSSGTRNMIIPVKTLIELARVIEGEGSVTIRASENQVVCTYHDVELVSRILEGQYPEYKDIIPNDLPTSATVEREFLVSAVRTAGLFSKTGAQDVRIKINPTQKRIELFAEASQVGGHQQTIPAEIKGPADEVVFNYRYLLEGLLAFRGSKVVFATGGSGSPGKITSADDAGYLYIVMPIKL